MDSNEYLDRCRWVLARTIEGLLAFRRLAVRYDRCAITFTALAALVVTVFCAQRLFQNNY